MTERSQTTGVSEKEFDNLEQYAEKSMEAHRLSEVLSEVPSLLQRGAIYLISAAILITLAILYFGKVHVVVAVKGTIFPEGEAFQVQARGSGVVSQVLAKEGDHLPRGATIVKYHRKESDLDLASLNRKVRLQRNQLKTAREAAQVVENILANVEGFLSSNHKVLISGNTMQHIAALKKAWLDQKKNDQLKEKDFKLKKRLLLRQIKLTEQKIGLLKKNRISAEKELKQEKEFLAKKEKRLKEFLQLAERGFFPKIDVDSEEERYRSAELAVVGKQKQIDDMELQISNERLRLADMKLKVKSEEADVDERYELARMNYQQKLTDLQQELGNLYTEVEELEAEIKNTGGEITLRESEISFGTVTMPLEGTITQLKVGNPGEMIGAGAVVAIVVADTEFLMVKASAKSKDIGFVTEGLPARIKVDAYPFQQFGTVSGRITKVFPNIGSDANFTVNIQLLENKIDAGDQDIRLSPGLTVEADVLTRKQRLIHMLLAKDQKKGKSE